MIVKRLNEPNIYNIPPSSSFADNLVLGITRRVRNNFERLSKVTVLLPTRRACTSVRDAFLRLNNGRSMLLPRLRPLGDMGEEELDLSYDKSLGADEETAEMVKIPPSI